jgi:hypothetical protein
MYISRTIHERYPYFAFATGTGWRVLDCLAEGRTFVSEEYDDKEDLKIGASRIINNFKEFKKNIFSTIKDPGGYFLKNVRLIKDFSDRNSPMSVAAKSSLMDIMYKAASEAEDGESGGEGGAGGPGNDEQPPFPGDEDAPADLDDQVSDTMTYGDVPAGIMASPPKEDGEEETGRPPGEPEGGDVIDGPPNGQEGGGQPPPPPTGDAKDVSDYIDKVAAGAEMVDLSEIRRPLHKRSLVELLYSR